MLRLIYHVNLRSIYHDTFIDISNRAKRMVFDYVNQISMCSFCKTYYGYGASCNCGKNGENEEPHKQGAESTCHTELRLIKSNTNQLQG